VEWKSARPWEVGDEGDRARAGLRRQDIPYQHPTGVNKMEQMAG
jgi:hypothetical protein